MPVSPTPISLIEAYFDTELKRSSLSYFDEVTEDNWIEFAKYYLSNMTRDFLPHFLDVPPDSQKKVRLYFEPRLATYWDANIQHPTPLLGLKPYPNGPITDRKQVSAMLAPLNKHLLFAHSLFVRDNFYYCFDMVADSVDKKDWRNNPVSRDIVERGIVGIKQWLPILVELRVFIEAGILVFMPYYITPSFPYGGSAPKLRDAFERLRLKPDQKSPPPKPVTLDLDAWDKPPVIPTNVPARQSVSEDDVIAAWLNARLLGLDVAFPDRQSFDFGSRLYFEEVPSTPDVVTDLMSIEVLPFGNSPKSLSLDDLWKIRSGESVFNELRTVVADCKVYLEENLGSGSSQRGATDMCRTFLTDQLSSLTGENALRFLEGPKASVATSVVVGVGITLVTANPAAGVAIGTAVNPSFIRLLQNRFSSKRRAVAQLQALL